MHGFLAGFNSPESVLADQNDLFSVFATDFEKREFCKCDLIIDYCVEFKYYHIFLHFKMWDQF